MAYRLPPKTKRADLKAEAEAALAAFREKGGTVKQMPSAAPVAFACKNCGHTGFIAARPDQKVRCPKCRDYLSLNTSQG